MSSATADEVPHTAPTIPRNIGRFSSATILEEMRMAPLRTPAALNPAIARPTISAVEVGAASHIALPTSKIRSAVWKTHFKEK
jgi:hypothetical protein